jgi:SAM-dependent methyltransferase
MFDSVRRNRLWRERPGRGIRPRVTSASPPRLFDRALIARRLDRALKKPAPGADFLIRRAAEELLDRLSLVKRSFPVAADIGTPTPHAAESISARAGARLTLRLAPTLLSAKLGGEVCVGDPERLPFAGQSLDLAISIYALQTVNDLPGALIQMRLALKPDGLVIAALAGGDTLFELRHALTVAESEILGGAAPRVAPFADVRALGALLQRAGLALPVVDSDRVVARYADMFALIRDLRAFGATNALLSRDRRPVPRAVFLRAAQVYAKEFSDPDGRLRATFETLWISGWAPHQSQPQPLKPGSARMRIEDALRPERNIRDPS